MFLSIFKSLISKENPKEDNVLEYNKKQVIYPNIFARVLFGIVDPLFIFYISKVIILVPLYFISKIFYMDDLSILGQEITFYNFNDVVFNHESLMKLSNTGFVLLLFFFNNIVTYFILGIYHVYFWYKLGATPIKKLLGMQIISKDLISKPKITDLIIRFLALSLLFPISIVVGVFHKNSRSLHDILSGTSVISSSNTLIKNIVSKLDSITESAFNKK